MGVNTIELSDCSVLLTSPSQYEECIVEVETSEDLLFILSDEHRDGVCMVELPGDGERIIRRIPLLALRALLDAAERKLVGKDDPGGD